MLVKASRPILIQSLHRASSPSCNKHPVYDHTAHSILLSIIKSGRNNYYTSFRLLLIKTCCFVEMINIMACIISYLQMQINIFFIFYCCTVRFDNINILFTKKMHHFIKNIKCTAKISHVCSYMFRSAWTIFREPMPSLAKVTVLLN